MKSRSNLGQTEFDALLNLLSGNREEAGDLYEKLRRGLLRFFYYKGFSDPASLADETFNRVAARTHKFDPSTNASLECYFYGFAVRIAMEHKRSIARELSQNSSEMNGNAVFIDPADNASESDCLENCLGTLREEDCELLIEYYSDEGRERIKHRTEMCERLNCSPSALHTRISRTKDRLRPCISDCMKNKM